MRRLVLLAAALALAVGTFQSAHGAPPREVKVPNLIGLKRSQAEARLTEDGFRYLLPAPRAERFEALAPPSGRTEEAVPEAMAPDRKVVAQEPSPGGSAGAGDLIPFGTVLPPDTGARDTYIFRHELDRTKVWPDDRQLTLHWRDLAPRCHALDHVDVGFAARYIAVEPSVTGTLESERHCSHLSKRVAHLDLDEPVGDRIVIDSVPVRPRRGLKRVEPTPYVSARGAPNARAVAVQLAHSSDCGLLARTEVRGTRHSVTITTFTGNTHRGRLCLADLITDQTVVPLRHPLGDRRIIDGARRR
jgi:hypothetical protein